MKLLQLSLTGGAAFREVSALLAGLRLEEAARRTEAPHTVAELLAHLRLTTRLSLDLVTGARAAWPEGFDVWPTPPQTEEELAALLTALHLLLAEAAMLADDPSRRSSELLTDLAAHNAYHWGQVALLRRMAGTDFGEA